MTSTSVPSRLGELFRRNGSLPTSPSELTARVEEPEATTSEQSTSAARGGADTLAPGQVQKAARRRYSKEEKRRILRLADACPPGQIGALLRREGIYYSTLRDFQKQRDEGKLASGPSKPRTEPPARRHADSQRLAQLEAEVQKLKRQLAQAEIVIDLQKKLSPLPGLTLPEEPTHS